MRPRLLLPAVTAAIALGTAAQAVAAPVITVSRPCLNSKSPMTVTGTGFAPNVEVRVKENGVQRATIGTGPDGSFVAAFEAPLSIEDANQAPKPVAYEAVENLNRASVARATVVKTRPGAFVPTRGVTRNRMTLRMTGYEVGQPIYAHLRWNRRWQRRIQLGTAQGPCGYLRSTRKLFRKLGTTRGRSIYVQFDQNPVPSTTSHQTSVLRYVVRKGTRGNPESYRLTYNGWRERTTP